jgi:hypothetical protein
VTFAQPNPKVLVRESPESLVLELPSPRRPLTAFVVGAWLVGWAVGIAFLVQQLDPGQPSPTDRAFLVVFGLAWLGAGALAAAWFAWLVAGHERVTVFADRVVIRRGIPGLHATREYATSGISELRTFGREVPPLLAAGLDFTGRGASGIRFRSGGRVVRFARALEEREAHAIVDLLRARQVAGERPGAAVEGAA